jgi:hypothetical protein
MKTIKIKLLNAYNEVEYKEVACLFYTKLYSVTKTINNDELPTYTVTHNKTGRRVLAFSNFNVAKDFCLEANAKWYINPTDRNNIKDFHGWVEMFISSVTNSFYYLSQLRG